VKRPVDVAFPFVESVFCILRYTVDFFGGHTHCAKFSGLTSAFLPITASAIQGSAIGLASFVVNAADLTPVRAGNSLAKCTDDTYLIVPAINVDSRTLELDNIEEWAKPNNLTLNRGKSAEIVIIDRQRKCHDTQPSSLPDIRRVSTIKILGVTISNKQSVNDHVSNIVSKCSQTLYALTILRAHGLCTQLYKQSSGQSSSPGCYTPAAPGGDTHRPSTDSELQLSSAEKLDGVSVLHTYHASKN